MKHLLRSEFFQVITNQLAKPNATDTDNNKPSSVNKLPLQNQTIKSGLTPYNGTWEKEQIMHLLRRSLFGVTVEDYHRFSNLTLNQSLDLLLTQSPDPSPPLNNYSTHEYIDPEVKFGEPWISCHLVSDGILNKKEAERNSKRMQSLTAWWIGRILQQDCSLTEKMTLFWHNQMAAEFFFIFDAIKSYSYAAPLRLQSLGNFKKLLTDIVTTPGMLSYLSNDSSTAKAPNENLSREMQELFTVGKGNDSHYTQTDVQSAARVLTGWTTTHPKCTAFFADFLHDTGDKKFSSFYNNTIIKGRKGKAGAEELLELIDMIFSVQEVSKHLCRNLYRWFVYSEINEFTEATIIEPLAQILRENKYDVIPVLRALLGSEHFFDKLNMGCQIKNPIDYLIGYCRQLKVADFPTDIVKQYKAWASISEKLNEMGMCPGCPPNVAGWSSYYVSPGYYQLWINADTIVARYEAIDNLSSIDGLYSKAPTVSLRFDFLAFLSELSDPADSEKIIMESTFFLSPIAFDSEQFTFLKKILSPDDTTNTWSNVWNDYKNDTNNESKKKVVLERISLFYSYILKLDECQLM